MAAGQIRDFIGLDVTDELVCQRLCEAKLNENAAQKALLSSDAKVKIPPFTQTYVHWTTD